ncbi:sensor histidine kinase [Gordonia sp. DT218]|uniref:sensor histidine kinase n=1 Tax=Gordonia sp. DT218 TaxID=3416659 RepID=UPI003CF21EA5
MARDPTTDRLLASLRYAPVVVVPCLLLASNFPGRFSVSAGYWLLSVAAVGVFIAGKWWPAAASVVLSAIAVPMFATDAWGLSQLVPYLGMVAVADVIMRAPIRWRAAAAAAAWTAAVVADTTMDVHADVWSVPSVVKIIAYVGLPILLGLFLRSQRDLAASYRQRAIDAEARRELAEKQARTDERVALARELHDLVAHHMASIVLRIGVAQHVLKPDDKAVGSVLADVRDTAADALADTRRLLAALRDPVLGDVALVEPDLMVSAITAAADRARTAGFVMSTTMSGDADELARLDALGRLTLLRVVQEALTNVMKHADVEHPVSVVITAAADQIQVEIDNRRVSSGTGTGTGTGHGIAGMRERVELVGGTLDAGTTGSGGWHVRAEIPLAGQEIRQ